MSIAIRSAHDVSPSAENLPLPRLLAGRLPWNRTTWLALAALLILWAILFSSTWATWGNPTVDSGREMYVARAVAQGQTLYRDVWYLYGPLAPYLNGLLFRLFGVRLEVLYWAGSLSALGSAIFLYFSGMQLSSWLAGWTTAAVVLIQAFPPGIFTFPLPYSFASVYGCLGACLLLWLGLRSLESSRAWIFAAGIAACVSLLTKLEFGSAAYAFLFLLIAERFRRSRSGKSLLRDLVAVLPGILVCLIVIGWMISLRGADFITQENIMSWPTSYFMRTYGARWLGLDITLASVVATAWPILLLVAFAGFVRWVLPRLPGSERWFFPGLVVLLTVVGLGSAAPTLYAHHLEAGFQAIFFPAAMVALVAAGAGVVGWLLWRGKVQRDAIPLFLLAVFASLLDFRMSFITSSSGYSIYYDGPVVLAFLLFVRFMLPTVPRWSGLREQWELVFCFGCLAVVSATAAAADRPSAANWVLVRTDHGSIRVLPPLASRYKLEIDFMKESIAHGDYVLSVPEDVSVYFFSDAQCPTRLLEFTPGALAPGKMTDELIHQIESKPVRYLLWAERKFPEYGVPEFGKDYDQFFGDYLRLHYRPVRSLAPPGQKVWSVVVWERIPAGESR